MVKSGKRKGGLILDSKAKVKIGVISDTHLRRVTPELEDIYEKYLKDKDFILHAGDFVCSEVVDFFSGKSREFFGVCGNMDLPEVVQRLDEKEVVELGGFRVGLIHGWGSPDGLEERIRGEFKNVDAVVFGHSHRPVNYMREGVLVFNPGTASGFSLSRERSLGVLEINEMIRGEIISLPRTPDQVRGRL